MFFSGKIRPRKAMFQILLEWKAREKKSEDSPKLMTSSPTFQMIPDFPPKNYVQDKDHVKTNLCGD